ncbi:MAG TPA: DUF4349 domain-containing protein [Gemmatimonadaceae bacterium]|nr:DUF4349 domain-containing protein [Gemmatimonadaceae bacterium]
MRPSRLVQHLRHATGRHAALAAAVVGLLACNQASERPAAIDEGTPAPPPTTPSMRREAARARGDGFGSAIGSVAGKAAAPERDLAMPAGPVQRSVELASNLSTGAASTQGLTIAPDMIIRTGQVVVEVRALDSAVTRLRDLARSLGGYVANTSMESGSEQLRSATIEVKLPAARFDQALAGMSALGKVESANTTAEDVGEEYVDLAARVSNARRLEDRLIDLLARRTGKLEEVLNVERELARVREEIERYEGRMRYLRTRAAISTLTITLHEPRPVLGPPRSPGIIAEAFRDAWRNFVGLVAGLIAASGVLVPLAGLGVLVWWLIRRWRQANPPAPARPRRAVPPGEDADRAA